MTRLCMSHDAEQPAVIGDLRGAPPNKRLKLAGGDRYKGIGMLFARGHSLSFSIGCASGRVARSLSAIR